MNPNVSSPRKRQSTTFRRVQSIGTAVRVKDNIIYCNCPGSHTAFLTFSRAPASRGVPYWHCRNRHLVHEPLRCTFYIWHADLLAIHPELPVDPLAFRNPQSVLAPAPPLVAQSADFVRKKGKRKVENSIEVSVVATPARKKRKIFEQPVVEQGPLDIMLKKMVAGRKGPVDDGKVADKAVRKTEKESQSTEYDFSDIDDEVLHQLSLAEKSFQRRHSISHPAAPPSCSPNPHAQRPFSLFIPSFTTLSTIPPTTTPTDPPDPLHCEPDTQDFPLPSLPNGLPTPITAQKPPQASQDIPEDASFESEPLPFVDPSVDSLFSESLMDSPAALMANRRSRRIPRIQSRPNFSEMRVTGPSNVSGSGVSLGKKFSPTDIYGLRAKNIKYLLAEGRVMANLADEILEIVGDLMEDARQLEAAKKEQDAEVEQISNRILALEEEVLMLKAGLR